MYINHIKILNYRNFHEFEMNFHDGLNVIVGANNAGKTGLLSAINLLYESSSISVDDFNKNDLQAKCTSVYKDVPPEIVIEYHIKHQISEDNTADESIIKLLSFIGMDEIETSKTASGDPTNYTLSACVKAKYTLNPKNVGDYIQAVSGALIMKRFLPCSSCFKSIMVGYIQMVFQKHL